MNETCPTDVLYAMVANSTSFDAVPPELAPLAAVAPYILLGASLVALLAGNLLIKPTCALVGFGAGALGAMRLLDWQTHIEMSCHAAIAICVVAGSALAILATCLIRAACFLIGAAAGGGLVWLVFSLWPALDRELWTGAPRFLGHTAVPFWTAVALVALAAGIACKREHRRVIIVGTSAVGAFGAAVFADIALQSDEEWPFYAVFGGAFVVGVAVQWYTDRRRRARARRAS